MTSIVAATHDYEKWLRAALKARGLAAVEEDLKLKHRHMAEAAFPFLRATFYRWAALYPEVVPDAAAAPEVLAVGDLHVENFGTWRDAEGRLVWGVNDVDEAYAMPYTIDLVRLATSAILAAREGHLAIKGKDASAAILAGYAHALERGGHAFVLEEDHPQLRAAALSAERDPERYWERMAAWREVKPRPAIRKLLEAHLPKGTSGLRLAHRIAGLGSLGRPRFIAAARSGDAFIAREAKTMLPSAYAWALGRPATKVLGGTLLARARRCPDPFFAIADDWLVRRLGPHCSRIELWMLPKKRAEDQLLWAMGAETANLHLGSGDAIRAIAPDLARRPKGWLHAAAKAMAEATVAEWKAWRAR